MVTCFLGIGSNVGARRQNIKLAIKKINSLEGTKTIKLSRIIETKAMGGPAGQPKYLNAALKIETNLTPSMLLRGLKKIELELGRKKAVRWGPRIIDLDILFYADKTVNTRNLKIPHPRALERDFVVKPLMEVV